MHIRTPSEALIECRIEDEPLDCAALRRSLPDLPGCGGYVAFEGLIRNINHGRRVLRLEYEAYTSLAVKEMQRIAQLAASTYGLEYVRCVHRRGNLAIGDTAVVIQVLSRHRQAAFDGCRFVIDQLKASVPIWKKEYYDDGSSAWTQCHETGHGHQHGSPLSLGSM